MASAMASAAARGVPPPYAIPVGPRIRPPRLLPGTKAANTDPQPDEPSPEKNQVWVQGKWRNVNSNAAKDQRQIQSRRAEKALRHTTHGMNIYAYSHIRTNQVVYSLSRVMQNNKILSQLVFHGKQTVPSALRRDAWRPYFSIHFPQTPAGAEAGLQAYHRLRELATWRQLSPPPEMLIATEEDVEKAKKKYNPIHLHRGMKHHTLKDMPIVNKMLPRKLRARRLMDQKATSVADAAYVLDLINNDSTPAEQLDKIRERQEDKRARLSRRATNRLEIIREKELAKKDQIQARQDLIQPREGQLGLTRHAAERIAHEHEGAIVGENMVTDLGDIESSREATNEYTAFDAEMRQIAEQDSSKFDEQAYRDSYTKQWREQNNESEGPSSELVSKAVDQERERVTAQLTNPEVFQKKKERNDASKMVQVLWTDFRDAAWAERWSSNVHHGELEARAVVKRQHTIVRQEAEIDVDGQEISEQRQRVLAQESSSPHLFGRRDGSGWYETPEQLTEKLQTGRQAKLEAWQQSRVTRSKEIMSEIDTLQIERAELLLKKEEIEPDYRAAEHAEAQRGAVQNLTDAEREALRSSMSAIEEGLVDNQAKLDEFEQNYPALFQKATELVEWREGRERYLEILRIREKLQAMDPSHDKIDSEITSQLQSIDVLLSTYAETYSELLGIENTESDLAHRTLRHNRNIARLEKKISNLESEEASEQNEASIVELKDELRDEKRYIATDQEATWERRIYAVDQVVEGLGEEYVTATSLLQNRIYAERSNDREALENIQMELKEQEEAKMEHLLGLDGKLLKSDIVVTEFDENLRKRGIEMPPPPKKGIWGRVKSVFGR